MELDKVGVLSPHLFAIYVDELSTQLNSLSAGCYIDGISVNHFLYADDSAEDDYEKEADETELERILKKNEYYKKLKEDREFKAKQLPITDQRFIRKSEKKSQMKKNDDETEDDGFGHKVKLLDIPGTVQVFYEDRTI